MTQEKEKLRKRDALSTEEHKLETRFIATRDIISSESLKENEEKNPSFN